MIASTIFKPASEIVYPESDGLPLADNTKQLNWIIALITNLRALFRDNADVFIAGDQFWYPVKGEPEIRNAPDVYVVFGRPKGDRPSYKQWEEGGVPMTVVFEILSPGNDHLEMADKQAFYDDYGAEEYYVYDPDSNQLHGHVRRGDVLRRQRPMNGFVSPRLGIRFDLSGAELVVRYPDGRPFLTFEELAAESALAEQRAGQAEQRAGQAEQRAGQAEQRAGQAEQRAGQAEQRAARTAELALKVLRQAATPEEMLEWQRFLQDTPVRGQ